MKALLKKFVYWLLPREMTSSLWNYRILSGGLGQYRSMKRWECLDANLEPIPWYTYPAIEYLKQLDFSQKSVFEFGSGNSSRFWAKRCKRLVAVEDDQEWHAKMKGQFPPNVDYRFYPEAEAYIDSINGFAEKFDVIVIDGSHRYECAVQALGKLSEEGFIILDNSDWKEKTSQLLREADLIEVDMAGFGPINPYTWTTSFYFSRKVKLSPAQGRQPLPGPGSLDHRES
jgi:hypothetical protein